MKIFLLFLSIIVAFCLKLGYISADYSAEKYQRCSDSLKMYKTAYFKVTTECSKYRDSVEKRCDCY